LIYINFVSIIVNGYSLEPIRVDSSYIVSQYKSKDEALKGIFSIQPCSEKILQKIHTVLQSYKVLSNHVGDFLESSKVSWCQG